MKARLVRLVLGQLTLAIIFSAISVACSEDGSGTDQERLWDRRALARLQSPPLGLPPVRLSESKPVTIAKIALGRKLFFDRRLSLNNTMSCAMCHIPEQGFTNNELSTPIGVEGRSLRRNAPTILNVSYVDRLFLDGRENSLDSQAIAPLLAHDEMANPSAESLLARITGLADYEGLFEAAFGRGPSLALLGQAIASWERTLLAADAPFDRWRYGGQADALTWQEQQGFDIFMGKGQCAKCHLVTAGHGLFTDQAFHDTGIGYLRDVIERQEESPVLVEVAPQVLVPVQREVVEQVGQPRPTDTGRYEVTREPTDRWRFRTPTLRNVAVTGPYMHDGSLPTLDAVVRHYNRGGVPHSGLDPFVTPLGLSDTEIASVVAFLQSLTASNLAVLAADARSVTVGN
jgi:cytochrome c peroxidase